VCLLRREAIEVLRSGRTVRELADSLGVSQQTLSNWRRQDQLDRHERDDVSPPLTRAERAAALDGQLAELPAPEQAVKTALACWHKLNA
jgi:transposase-like protein